MISDNWLLISLISLCIVSIVNGLLASCTNLYYRKKAVGELTHSQLLIKQGRASFEHRLNVFGQTIIFGLVSLRIYLFTLITWLVISGYNYIS